MIQALVVDDEPMQVQGLFRHVDWELLGYAKPLSALSGDAALRIMREHRVDVLITDVSMPVMTGIELVARCKEADPSVQVLMISGFNEFEFVQEAIHVGAQGYVLKPIKVEEVEAKLSAFRIAIEKRRRIEQETNELQEKVSDSLIAVKERFAHDLIQGAVAGSMMESWSRLLELPSLTGGIRIAVFGYDRFMDGGLDARDRVIRGVGFQQAVSVGLSDIASVIVARISADEVLALHLNPTPETQAMMEKQIAFIQRFMEEQYGTTVTVGISHKFAEWDETSLAYKRAKFMIARARLIEGGQLLYEDRLDKTDYQDYRVREEYIPEIVRMLAESDDATEVLEYARNVFDMLVTRHSFSYIQAFGIGLISELMRRQKQTDTSASEWNVNVMQRLIDSNQASSVRDMVLDYIGRYAAAERTEQVNQQHHLIRKIEAYIEEHLHENVTVKHLAELHLINVSYLSVLFKKETGKTVLEFIQETRMNKAIELLQDPTIRIYEVAERVGFQTAAYFAYLFKKFTGRTPQEYRDYHWK
ncbi:response regulator [Cohnella sp. GCM10020058]|uniref:response regulator transcription factor n=1 Tax=Cohnella sp. GCM10020058 TaxID=3317330 RepID=UPI003636DFA6